MHGEKIFVRTLSSNETRDKFGNTWQYHSRSDYHSKVISWCVFFDHFLHSKLLRKHFQGEQIGFGINHEIHDFQNNRKKDLDMVICTPSGEFDSKRSFVQLYQDYGIALTYKELNALESLPAVERCDVASPLIAIEAKACMTAHSKACPRLYDELASSFQVINGGTNDTIAAAHVTINLSNSFISADRNKKNLDEGEAEVTEHKQPNDAKKVYNKIKELKRRSSPSDSGYDAVGVSLIKLKNDDSPVTVHSEFGDKTGLDPIMTYDNFIDRLSVIYAQRFAGL